MKPGAETALAQARRLLEPGSHPPWPDIGEAALSLAWALKDLCYEAWSTEPGRAVRAAEALRRLAGAGVPPPQAREIQALADWTAGIACLTRGQMAEAVRCFDGAAVGLLAAGLPDPAAQTQVPKIMALSMLGQHEQAARCAETTQLELVALGNLRAAARVSQNLGNLQCRRDLYPEAVRHYREAAVLFARLGDHEHSVLADIGLAAALTSMGDFDEALRIHARARMRAGNQGLELQLALVDESVALLDLPRGRYREALAGLESARRRYEALAMPQYLAIAEKQLADAYLELRLLPEALALFDGAVAKLRALDMPDEEAWALAQQGRAQALLGQAEAGETFAAAARVFTAQGNQVGGSAVALARAELALKSDDADAALAWAKQAVAGFAAAGQADGRSRAEVVRAQALLQAGQVAEARAAFSVTLEQARAQQLISVQVRCLTGLGLAAQAQGEVALAQASLEAAIELFELQRSALPGDEIRAAFLTDHLRPYEERLRMAVATGTGEEALRQLDRFRARALDERLAEGGYEGPETGPRAPAEAEIQPLRERLNWLYRRIQRLHDEADTSAALSAELLRTEHELLERARRQRLAAPLRHGSAASSLAIAALQGALQDGDALVEYGALDGELFACTVTRERVTLVRHMAPWPEVLDAVRGARFQIDTLRHGAAPVRQHMARLTERTGLRLARLHAQVWAPLAGALAGCRRVLVVPHAQLGALPFAALSDGQQTLGQRCELAVAPSARAALRGLQRPPTLAHTALVLGESSRLPHTGLEAAFVAGLFEHGHAFVGEHATLAALRAHASAADIVHLACHAQFRSDNPRFSALHLHDGALTVELAEALGLKACTVVLSACETGLADVGTGDEMVGLVRAFLVAGAARVLASQWPVDDEVTVGFMSRFYGALLGGQGPAAALRSAQAATMQEHPHPYFWAAFTLYGGW